ncbi:hypothetical protein HPB49_003419 [Dermacentor silvarum]|uniref:Uncharacterized protein n=1 Tax=Dermacentor silvarum TaxID=543639 RepID=A0ACB8DAJ2_DERSI|nr:hypothetical protein HPB49_003419 [Dermacentor silvarum]
MPNDHFRLHFCLSKETVRLLCEKLPGELKSERATGLSVERKVLCALRFFAIGSFQASLGSEQTIRVSQSTVSEGVRRVAEAVLNAGARNKWVHFPKTSEEGDSSYPLEPWLLTPVPGHPPTQTAEGKYNTAYAAMRSLVERCIGLFMSRFRCLQRYRTLLYEPEGAVNIVAACAVLHTQPSAV